MSPIFYSLFVIIISFIASSVLFLRIKKNQILHTRFFFWHYALGFLIVGLIYIPIFFINLRLFTITYNFLLTLYSIGFLALLFSYSLFYRGTVLLYTKDRFITTIFPIVFLPLFAALTMLAMFFQKVSTPMLFTGIVWGFLLPITGYLAAIFFYFFIKGAPADGMKKRPYTLILSFAWFIILLSIIFSWFEVANYDPNFWILKIATLNKYFLIQAVAYLLILIGSLSYGKYLVHSETVGKE